MQVDRWFVAVVGVLILTASDVMAQDQTRVYAIWGNPNDGRKVYAAKGCGRCHAINSVGPTIGPDLGRPLARPQTITQLAGAMWNHAPEMRKLAQEKGLKWAGFKESELRDLIAYLYFLRMLDQPGDVRRGERLFDDKRCSTCHAVAGRGSRIASTTSRNGSGYRQCGGVSPIGRCRKGLAGCTRWAAQACSCSSCRR